MLSEHAVEGLLIECSEELVHLFAVDTRGKGRQFRETPVEIAARNVGIVALVHLECGHTLPYKASVVIVGEDSSHGGVGEVGHQTIPYQMASRPCLERLIQRRSGMNESMFP